MNVSEEVVVKVRILFLSYCNILTSHYEVACYLMLYLPLLGIANSFLGNMHHTVYRETKKLKTVNTEPPSKSCFNLKIQATTLKIKF